MNKFPKSFFITATDTDVGKTFISAILCQGLKAAYWKPIQAGHPKDTCWIKEHTTLPTKNFIKERHIFKMPASPHLASRKENINISLDDFTIPNFSFSNHLIIEGCGGLLVPLNNNGDFVIDLIKKLDIPCLLVTRSSLGTINHTLQSLKLLRSYNIPILSVVMNGEINTENKLAIETYGKIKVIAQINKQNHINNNILQKLFEENF
jgi:dethiobiotin synthase